MSKNKTQYVCQSCGYQSTKWLGRCVGCEGWNTLVEEKMADSPKVSESSLSSLREDLRSTMQGEGEAVPLSQVSENLEQLRRLDTGISELNRVLGGGLIYDSFVLLGGDPGIGKSTLLLQMAKGLIEKDKEVRVLYLSGEESVSQIKGRAFRLGLKDTDQIYLASETQLEKAFDHVKKVSPDVLVVDSLQTFSSAYLESAPGSVSQLREVASRLMTLAKTAEIAVCLVGHVTKEGSIAGPKVVEHIVDTVLYFEGDEGQSYRLLRAVKNRFGSSRELGVFEMDTEGLREVKNPSALFLTDRKESVSGTAIAASIEGTRPLLVELQALVVDSPLALPRRTSVGMDGSRISLLSAIVERHLRSSLAKKDLFFNVSGGLKLSEPGCDLAACVAIWSSAHQITVPQDWVFLGELGLTGEVKRVSHPEMRLEEAKKLGFKTAIIPAGVYERVKKITGIKLHPIERLSELAHILKKN